jgi:hypothetical protein
MLSVVAQAPPLPPVRVLSQLHQSTAVSERGEVESPRDTLLPTELQPAPLGEKCQIRPELGDAQESGASNTPGSYCDATRVCEARDVSVLGWTTYRSSPASESPSAKNASVLCVE